MEFPLRFYANPNKLPEYFFDFANPFNKGFFRNNINGMPHSKRGDLYWTFAITAFEVSGQPRATEFEISVDDDGALGMDSTHLENNRTVIFQWAEEERKCKFSIQDSCDALWLRLYCYYFGEDSRSLHRVVFD
ncbi:hypothetical protein EON64_07885 [archaeon]|nr:MAG: hypothetical protein EON64_07885 [archaeon]